MHHVWHVLGWVFCGIGIAIVGYVFVAVIESIVNEVRKQINSRNKG